MLTILLGKVTSSAEMNLGHWLGRSSESDSLIVEVVSVDQS